MLKTKDNVDPVGLSPPPVPLKPLMLSLDLDLSPLDLNNNWLTVPPVTEIWDAMVVLWTMLSNTSLTTVSPPKMLIPTPLEMDLVPPILVT